MSADNLKTMRDILIDGIYEKMKEREDVFFVSADFGAPSLDKLREDFKDRFTNVGIAEQNLVNIATGIALEGNVAYAYAIAPFVTMRGYEQIRQSLAMSSQVNPINVNIVGVGAGLSYQVAGPSHHCLGDISIMRLFPNFTVFSPSDGNLVRKFVDYSINKNGPKYLRLDGKLTSQIYKDIDDFDFEKGFYELVKGNDICLVSTGYSTHVALGAARENSNIGIIDVFMLKPLNEKLLAEVLGKYKHIISIEEAFINNGGLDSLISKIIRDYQINVKFNNLGFNDKYVFEMGGRDYLHEINGLDKKSIINLVRKINN